jgi:hypothetical protein
VLSDPLGLGQESVGLGSGGPEPAVELDELDGVEGQVGGLAVGLSGGVLFGGVLLGGVLLGGGAECEPPPPGRAPVGLPGSTGGSGGWWRGRPCCGGGVGRTGTVTPTPRA